MGSIDIFLFYQKHKENQSQQASQTGPVGNEEGMGSSCAQTEKTES